MPFFPRPERPFPPAVLASCLVFLLIPAACSAGEPRGLAGPEGIALEPAFPALSFTNPVDLQHPGDETDRLFVVEQDGVIRVFENSPSAASVETFLDIRDRVSRAGSEMGLLGLAFHPNYEQNGFFFVDYTAADPRRTVIARYRVDPADPDRADPASEHVILEVEQPYSNHNGGQIAFGPDGFLYIALGDGGSGGDPQNHGQNRSTLLGAILRIDVDNPSGGRAYGIPPDNPLVGAQCGPQGCRGEIYAYGLRNPWRFSFDPVTGRLWAGDVGQNELEEIDLIEKGGNYGWRLMEGTNCYNPSSGCNPGGLILPVWEYSHRLGASVTGGYVYRGAAVPGLAGAYIYADYTNGRVWALRYDGSGTPENTEILDSSLRISSFGVDRNNELYVLDHGGSGKQIYRFKMTATGVVDEPAPASGFQLHPNHPNPFRQATTIPYTLARSARVELAVYDVVGRRVRALFTGLQPPGKHEVSWDGTNAEGRPLPGGVYLCRLLVEGVRAETRRLVRVN